MERNKINRKHMLPIVLVVLGIIDQSTNLLSDLLIQINAPLWTGTILKIVIISFGALKLYLIEPKK